MPFNLQIEAFFFNAEKDYLPHYRKAEIKIERGSSVKNLLETLATKLDGFVYPEEKTLVRINGKVVDAALSIDEIVEHFGTDLRLEPASTYRATRQLCFDDTDFMEKFQPFAPYCDEEDKAFYQSLYHTHYASEAFAYNRDYVGDAAIALAHRLVRNGSEHAQAIFRLLADDINGIWLYEREQNSLPEVNLEQEVAYLKGRIEKHGKLAKREGFFDRLKRKMAAGKATATDAARRLEEQYGSASALECLENAAPEFRHSFPGVTMAFYYGTEESKKESGAKLIEGVKGKRIEFALAGKACGEKMAVEAPAVAFKKAGAVLLDAMDSGAEILVVDSEAAFRHFYDCRCAKAVGREIDLKVVTAAQLILAATGAIDLGLDHLPEAGTPLKKAS